MTHKFPFPLAPRQPSSGLPVCSVIQGICLLAEGARLHPLNTLFPQTPHLARWDTSSFLPMISKFPGYQPCSFKASPNISLQFISPHLHPFCKHTQKLPFRLCQLSVFYCLHFELQFTSKLELSKCVSFKHSICFTCQHTQSCSENTTKTVGTGKIPITAPGRITATCRSLKRHTTCLGLHML